MQRRAEAADCDTAGLGASMAGGMEKYWYTFNVQGKQLRPIT